VLAGPPLRMCLKPSATQTNRRSNQLNHPPTIAAARATTVVRRSARHPRAGHRRERPTN
jgi:hypothetical protein